MQRKGAERRKQYYGSLFGVIIHRVQGITAVFMLLLTLAKPLKRFSYPHVPASLRPATCPFIAAIYNQMHSQDALRELLAKGGEPQVLPLFHVEKSQLYRTVENRHVRQFVKD